MAEDATGDADRLFGNKGNDFVDGRDRDRKDIINCGPGRDTYDRDRGDTVKDNCEKRRL